MSSFEESMEKRLSSRLAFIARAELTEEVSGTKLNCRVSDLSLYGCYIDTLNTLPKGTVVFTKIFVADALFEGNAVVIYAHPRLGMGLYFRDLKPHSLAVLKSWLKAAMP
jgi:hypothetical protein